MTSRESRQADGVIAPRVPGRVSHGPRARRWCGSAGFRIGYLRCHDGEPGPPDKGAAYQRTLIPSSFPSPSPPFFHFFVWTSDQDIYLFHLPFISFAFFHHLFCLLPSSDQFYEIPIAIDKAILSLASAYKSRIIRHHLTDNLAVHPSPSTTPRVSRPPKWSPPTAPPERPSTPG